MMMGVRKFDAIVVIAIVCNKTALVVNQLCFLSFIEEFAN